MDWRLLVVIFLKCNMRDTAIRNHVFDSQHWPIIYPNLAKKSNVGAVTALHFFPVPRTTWKILPPNIRLAGFPGGAKQGFVRLYW